MKRIFTMLLVTVLFAMSFSAGAVANPIKEVYDDDAFEDVLGIEVDDEELHAPDRKMVIIADAVGQIIFTTAEADAAPAEWVLRFTRDAEWSGDQALLSGVYAEDWVTAEPYEYTYRERDDDDDDRVTVTVTEMSSAALNTTAYFWSYRNVAYALTVTGSVSQAQFDRTFYNVMACCFD